MSISINHCGCSSALRFVKRKIYSGQKFFELNSQLVACADSRDANWHVLRDWHSIHQPHLILAKGFVLISGPPQGRYEQCDNGHFERENSDFFQNSSSRWRRRLNTSASSGGLVELLYFSLIFSDAGVGIGFLKTAAEADIDLIQNLCRLLKPSSRCLEITARSRVTSSKAFSITRVPRVRGGCY